MYKEENNFLENLEFQISMKENTYKNFKKIPVFSEQVKQFDKAVVKLQTKFDKIRLRDSYQTIIIELEELIQQSKN